LYRYSTEPDLTKRLSVKDSIQHKWCGSKAAEKDLTAAGLCTLNQVDP
jgi:hypothetical protein